MGRLGRITVDVTPLRSSRDFRLLYAGTAVSQFGSQLTAVAVPFLIFDLTESTLAVGLFGLTAFVPLLVLNIVGGAIADRVDRRTLIVAGQAVGFVAAGGLAANAFADRPQLWILYVLGTVDICAFAIAAPAERSAIIRLVERSQVASSMALKAISGSTARIVGPALSGVLLVVVGAGWTFVVDMATFVVAGLLVGRMHSLPPLTANAGPTASMVLDGFRHVRRQPILLGSFVSDLNAMVFGAPVALFPAVAATRFPGSPEVLGLLYAAPSVGSLLASVGSGWARNVTAHGRVVVLGVCGWGVSMAAFGVVDTLVPTLAFLGLAGAADMVSGISRQAILQLASPPELVGRMEGVGMAVWTSGPRLGDLEAGAVASVTSVDFAITSGGIACVVVMLLLARALPGFAAFRVDPTESAPTVPTLPP